MMYVLFHQVIVLPRVFQTLGLMTLVNAMFEIPPVDLIVDNPEWKVGKNRAPPRSQSAVKQTELFKTLHTLSFICN